jgi:hypothetical protein
MREDAPVRAQEQPAVEGCLLKAQRCVGVLADSE